MQLRSRGQAISAITLTNLLMKINNSSDDPRLRQSSVFRNAPSNNFLDEISSRGIAVDN